MTYLVASYSLLSSLFQIHQLPLRELNEMKERYSILNIISETQLFLIFIWYPMNYIYTLTVISIVASNSLQRQ